MFYLEVVFDGLIIMLLVFLNEDCLFVVVLKGSCIVYFGVEIGWCECLVYECDLLLFENEIVGFVLVEELIIMSFVQIGQIMCVIVEGIMFL